MGSEILIHVTEEETKVAIIEGGRLVEYFFDRKQSQGIVGNIYKGKVSKVLPGMQAAFVDIGLEKAAFLYVDDIFVEGVEILPEALRDDGPAPGPEEAGPEAIAKTDVAPPEPVKRAGRKPIEDNKRSDQHKRPPGHDLYQSSRPLSCLYAASQPCRSFQADHQ
jgi:ribonuclease G